MKKVIFKLGDICREAKQATKNPLDDGYERYVGLEHIDSDSLSLARWGSIENDRPSFNRVFKEGQLLFGKRRPYLRKAAIASFDGVCSGDIIVLKPKEDVVNRELFPFLIHSSKVWDRAIKTSSGSLSPRTKFKDLAEVEFILPELDYQGDLTARLVKAQGVKTLIEENIGSIHNLVSSLLQEKCGSLAKYNATDNLKDRCPKDCKVIQLRDVLEKTSRPIAMDDDTKYRTVVARRAHGGIDEREELFGRQISVKSQFMIEEGDFLISKRQIVHGGCGVVPESLHGSIVSNEYDVFRTSDDLDMTFLSWLVRTPRMKNYFLINSVGVHIEKMLFKTEQWLNMPIILPPLNVQKNIAQALEDTTKIRAIQERRKHHIEQMKSYFVSN